MHLSYYANLKDRAELRRVHARPLLELDRLPRSIGEPDPNYPLSAPATKKQRRKRQTPAIDALGRLGDGLDLALLLFHVLVLRHVLRVVEGVKVSRVRLGREGGDERHRLRTQAGPGHPGVERVSLDLFQARLASISVADQPDPTSVTITTTTTKKKRKGTS